MISIKDKKKCCGCSACVQRCPKQCINFREDNEGFRYPYIDTDKCINCGLCEKVCPIINQYNEKVPTKVYAAINTNEKIRMQSSSGGIFTYIATKVIEEKGVVFGARFDKNWEVKHDFTENIEGLSAFRGSKYMQSRIEDNYLKVEKFLKDGRKVLFSGTPCQIAGLKRYLKKNYENLLTIDIICHGVPSPKIWRLYLNEIYKKNLISHNIQENTGNKSHITDINFRDKSSGWKTYSFTLTLNNPNLPNRNIKYQETFTDNIFMKGFLNNLYLRPSCHDCAFKSGKSNSDITLADFWGINILSPKLDDNKGTGLIICNNDKLLDLFSLKTTFDYSEVIKYNISAIKSSIEHKNRTRFFKQIECCNSISKLIQEKIEFSIIDKIKIIIRKIKSIIKI